MELQIQFFKKKYAEFENYFTSKDSFDGTNINKVEQITLDYIKVGISKIEAEIVERKQLLSNIDMQGVYNKYDLLLDTINSTWKGVELTHKKWKNHIFSVGTCYAKAFETFEDTVKAQNQYKQDLANLTAAIISLMGVGTLSWISTSAILVEKFGKKIDDLFNIAEDVVQSFQDKAVTYAASKVGSVDKISLDGPLVFQNSISKKALAECTEILTKILICEGTVMECKKMIDSLRDQGIGSKHGSEDAKIQYEHFIKVESAIVNCLMVAGKWIKKLPEPINTKELTKDFERGFWSKWLPRLKGTKTVKSPSRDEFGIRDPNPVSYKVATYDDSFSSELSNRLTVLINLTAIGVGKNGLDNWVSDNDVILLIKWANGFKSTQNF